MFSGNAGLAHTRVSGTVTASEDGSPVPYAVVLVKGSRGVGTNTDSDGRYTLSNVPSDAELDANPAIVSQQNPDY